MNDSETTKLLAENAQLREQRDALQERCNRLLTQARGLRYQVDEFHEEFGHPRPRSIVQRLDEEMVRFRLRLIAEEFVEVLEAALSTDHFPEDEPWRWNSARAELKVIIDKHRIDMDLPAFVDGLADLDYVVEGTRISFGIDGRPLAAEVHRANMAKGANGPDGKPVKPEGWTPPDVEGELKKQGWES